MPTDESYLDSLLSGLSSGSEKKSDDRLSAYRRDKKAEEPSEGVTSTVTAPAEHEIPGFLNGFVTKEERRETQREPEEQFGDFFFEDPLQEPIPGADEPVVSEIDDEQPIDGYNIFSDYDDADIDRMIAEELSGEELTGELFVDSENNGFTGTEVSEPAEEAVADEVTDTITDAASDAPMEDIFSSLEEMTAELPVDEGPTDLFTFNTLPPEENDGDPFMEGDSSGGTVNFITEPDADPFDFSALGDLGDLGEDPLAESLPDLDGGDETPDIFASLSEEPAENDVFADLGAPDTEGFEDPLAVADSDETPEASPQEETFEDPLGISNDDPFAGLSFDNGEAEETPAKSESAAELLEAMGNDTLNADDIQALDNLFNEIDINEESDENSEEKKKKKKEKKPWYLALFGNVKIQDEKVKPEPTPEQLEAKAAEKAAAKKAAADAKKAAADEKKAAKEEQKAEKARQTAEQKEAAKAKKKAEIEKLILEETGNTYKINKAGAAVLFALFIGIAALVISGGSTLNYRAAVKEAQTNYDNALIYKDINFYEKAYNDIYGLELEEEDYKLGEKIYTVNFVSKQIASFNSHYAVGDYTSGLNDLYKGLLRYNKWMPYAQELGAEDDLLFVRTQILDVMKTNYEISEDEAMLVLQTYAGIAQTDGEAAANLYYTKYIYSAVEEVGLENSVGNE